MFYSDPRYNLKGGAKVALQYYAPKQELPPPPPDLLAMHTGNLSSVPLGREYLLALLNYGKAQHNIGHKTKDAIATFQEMLELDRLDHMVS